MKREENYIVIKMSDLDKAKYEDQIKLRAIAQRIERQRSCDGKEPLKTVVVEHDWPEYEQVWKMIEKRVGQEDDKRKFETMFDDKERLGYFFVVETHQGKFLLTSDAHSTNRLTEYSGYKYRAVFSPDHGYTDEIFTTSWSVHFKKVVPVYFDELVALYDPNAAISNYNIAEFIINKLKDAKTR